MKIEYAGGITIEDVNNSRRGVLARAPAWWRQLAERGGAAASSTGKTSKPTAKPSARAKPAVIGWIAGVACPGVSRPLAHCRKDGETTPEQFTPEALHRMLAKAYGKGRDVPVTFGHDGPVIATMRSLDVILHVEPITGLEFEVRLRDNEIGRKVLAEIDGRSLGVSIGFDVGSSWIVERDGIGRLRVVDDADLHHVAILPRSATLKPVYAGARCYGAKGGGIGCPTVLYRDARAWAFRLIKEQAGCKR
jgi:hypothetical protein